MGADYPEELENSSAVPPVRISLIGAAPGGPEEPRNFAAGTCPPLMNLNPGIWLLIPDSPVSSPWPHGGYAPWRCEIAKKDGPCDAVTL
jgi:hypothetical protein